MTIQLLNQKPIQHHQTTSTSPTDKQTELAHERGKLNHTLPQPETRHGKITLNVTNIQEKLNRIPLLVHKQTVGLIEPC